MLYDILGFICLVLVSLFTTEFYGYWLHTLLHSDKIRWLSIRHMEHHLVHYAPGKKQRPSYEYISPIEDRDDMSIFGLGLEWIFPSAILALFTASIEYFIFSLSPISILISIGIMVVYAVFMFGYLHDSMHIRNHWFNRVPFFKRYYKNIRKLHDVHHHAIMESGLLRYNMGISTHVFDKVFRTYLPNMKSIPRKDILSGHEKALTRYNISPNHNSTI